MRKIKKIILKNFKKFKNLEIDFNDYYNILIGDNEAGKSSILTAIDLVLSGSRSKIENFGLENLFNIDVIQDFLASPQKDISNLPTLEIELYFHEMNNFELCGKNNSKQENCDGLKLICKHKEDLAHEINNILQNSSDNFPFEYYDITFKTFSGDTYTGYKKYIRHLLIDSSQINNEYATKEYIKNLYNLSLNNQERFNKQNAYRQAKNEFTKNELSSFSQNDYAFSVKTSSKSNLETDLTIKHDDINIDNKGKGQQTLIKTEFALQQKSKQKKNQNIDIVLLEEPENHLSPLNMHKLIEKIKDSTDDSQIFITTHSSLIADRLNLKNAIILSNNKNDKVLKLNDLSEETANFFMKAPNHNVLEFILSNKVILVEGSAEFILMEKLFQQMSDNSSPHEFCIHIISGGGLTSERYLQISQITKTKVAVITDNDHDYQEKIINKYSKYSNTDHIGIFADSDNNIHTFEKAIYNLTLDFL